MWIDIVAVILQITGAWVSAVQVLRAFKGKTFKQLNTTWDKEGEVEYSSEFERFTFNMKLVFCIGLGVLSVGILFPLLKYLP